MKKQYEKVNIEISFIEEQDIVMASVFIEWDEDWQDGSNDYFFG